MIFVNISFSQITPPGGIGDSTNIILWLCPDTALYDSGSNVADVGDVVYEWHDISNNNFVFKNTTNNRRPILDSINDERFLNYTPGDFLENILIKDIINGLTEFSIFIVVKSDVTNTDNGFMDSEDPDGTDDNLCLRYDQSGYNTGSTNILKAGLLGNVPGNQIESADNTQTANVQVLTLTWKDGERLKLYINGAVNDSSVNQVSGPLNNIQKIIIGKGPKDITSASGWNGLIGTVIFYNQEFPVDTIQDISEDLGPIISVQNGNWNNPSTWDCNCVPTSTDDVVIDLLHTVTVNNGYIINDLTINNSATLRHQPNDQLTVNGHYINNGSETGGNNSSELIFAGIDKTISGFGTIGIGGEVYINGSGLTIATGSDLTINTDVYVNGDDLIISSGAAVNIANTFTINGDYTVTNYGTMDLDADLIGILPGSCWINGNNATLYVNAAVLLTGALTASASGNTVIYDSDADQDIKTPGSSYYHLTLTNTNEFAKYLTGNIDIDGDLTITGASVLKVTWNNYSITLAGNWINNSINFDPFRQDEGTVIFDGTITQSITNTNGETFYNLTINKSNNNIISNNDITIENTLTLTSGNLLLNGYDVIILEGATTNGGGPFSYIQAVGTSVLKKMFNATDSVIYHVGDGNFYSPFTLKFNSGSFAPGAYVSVNVVDAVNPNLPASDENYITRYWIATAGGITSPDYNVSYTYAADVVDVVGSENIIYAKKWNGVSWQQLNIVIEATNTLTGTGITSFSEFTGSGSIPTPIELLFFNAKFNEKEEVVELSWSTASETNNDYFTIEKATDGITFETVVFVNGAGNSNILNSYAVVDENPYEGVSYYRLKQTDFDGQVEYSDLSAVFWFGKETCDFRIFPNPANEMFYVSLTGCSIQDEVLIVVKNTIGQTFFSKVIRCYDNKIVEVIDTHNNIPPGTYIVIGTVNDEKFYNRKIVVCSY